MSLVFDDRFPRVLQIHPVWWGLALLLLPIVGYVILPALGNTTFVQWFDLFRLAKLAAAGVGLAVFISYVRWAVQRPWALVGFIILLWPLVEMTNDLLVYTVGLNIRLRLLLIVGLGAPTTWFLARYGRQLLRQVPHVLPYLTFVLLAAGYFLFFNANAADTRRIAEGAWSDGSIGFTQLTSYGFILCGMVLGAVSVFRHPTPWRWFHRFNLALLAVSSAWAVVTILAYPFGPTLGLFSQNIDGFLRAQGPFTHPNPYAHHMGILMVYLLGLMTFYQGQPGRIPAWLMTSALALNGVAFLLGLSKTAIAGVGLCGGLLFLLNLLVEDPRYPVLRRRLVRWAVVGAVLAPVALGVFQVVTDRSLFDLLGARLEEGTSLLWRTEAWNGLLASFSPEALLMGNGFTAANALMFQLTYNTLKNAQPLILVHNAYVSLFYDFGLLGSLMWAAVGLLAWQAIRRLGDPALQAIRPLMVTVIAMSLYFLLACGFDEMVYMFDAPHVFWLLTSVLTSLAVVETRRVTMAPVSRGPAFLQEPSPGCS